jgi:hypothetical protein
VTGWPPWLRRELLLVGAVGGGLGLLAYLVVTLASYRAPIVLWLAIGVAAAASWRLLVAAAPSVDLAGPADPEPETGPSSSGFENVSMLEHALSWGSVDVERYDARVRPQLVRLAEDRLRRHHGVDLASQPEAARRMVGEPLWQLMTGGPSPTPPGPSRLAGLLAEIERI